ncbi:hypothetical protein CSB37_01790 [bacterium DOLZORAL124_38_8]|nr:MAG: hypothetical protein CSB37_01790 [bacterium DOLZORAL124_38_8]
MTMFSVFGNFSLTQAGNCDIPAPDSCYKRKSSSEIKQKYIGNPSICKQKGEKIVLNQKQATYTNTKTKNSFSATTPINVKELQEYLIQHKYTKQYIKTNELCPERTLKDGLYGVCTQHVYQEFLKRSCEDQGEIIPKKDVRVLNKITEEEITNPTVKVYGKTIPIEKSIIPFVNFKANDEINVSAPNYQAVQMKAGDVKNIIYLTPQGENKTVIVKDANTKETLPGANIYGEKYSNKGIITNLEGSANLSQLALPSDEKIVFSFTGYEPKTFLITEVPDVVELVPGVELDEVVITGKKTKKTDIQWDEDLLRPKFLTGANWNNRTPQGDASDINYWLQKFSGKITGILSAIAVLIIAYNGFMLTVAGSDDDTLSKAKNAILWALVGLVGVNFVYIIVKTVISLAF